MKAWRCLQRRKRKKWKIKSKCTKNKYSNSSVKINIESRRKFLWREKRRRKPIIYLSIFDLFKLEDEPEILYRKGELLFHQLKDEIEKYTVTGETWLCHDDKNRGYRLQQENGLYNVVTNDSTDFYRTQKEAEYAARKWLAGKDVISPEQIRFSSVEAYQYIREYDG